jgi:hypothetical protein
VKRRPLQFASEAGPSMSGREEPRPVHIHRGFAVPSRRVLCSCCHDEVLEGVYAHTRRDDVFDPLVHAHVFVCLSCARQFGREAAVAS